MTKHWLLPNSKCFEKGWPHFLLLTAKMYSIQKKQSNAPTNLGLKARNSRPVMCFRIKLLWPWSKVPEILPEEEIMYEVYERRKRLIIGKAPTQTRLNGRKTPSATSVNTIPSKYCRLYLHASTKYIQKKKNPSTWRVFYFILLGQDYLLWVWHRLIIHDFILRWKFNKNSHCT